MSADFLIPEPWQCMLEPHSALVQSAVSVLSTSHFLLQWGLHQPKQAETLITSGDLERVYEVKTIQAKLQQWLTDVKDETALHQRLRQFRTREIARVIWRDLAGWADLTEVMRDLSALADACIEQTLTLLHQWQCRSLGTPCNKEGEPQSLIILGMGKLGAGELNLSSDIDLIFTYAKEGETQGGRRTYSNEEFFIRLGRKLIQALDNKTADGFVFRVDMRLRPFGDSGALATSFEAMEDYYQTQGREWERYAMIKARPITGPAEERQALSNMLRPFVYRRYLDYGLFDSLREMKALIAGQLHRKGMEDNIKLGAGGIREIEFIGQVFQLIYGGRDRALQQRPILTILELLAQRQLLSMQVAQNLKSAYVFLRRTEHRIQAWADQQIHLLPKDDSQRLRLAQSMGFATWDDFAETLVRIRARVHESFEQLLTAPQADNNAVQTVSLFIDSDEERLHYLAQSGYDDSEAVLYEIDKLLAHHSCRNLSQTGRTRLEKLLPLLVQAAAQVDNPDDCLKRLIPLLEAIMRRSAYMSLLVENPLALSQLIRLCSASPLISHQLARHPLLLDELLDPRSLYEVPERAEQEKMLNHTLASVDKDDLEQQMNLLREFRQIATLHVAAADVTEVLPLMRVGDQLSELAELQLDKVLKLSWQHLFERHGLPPGANETDLTKCGFAVLAYGKLGGLELGYGSDLDLVFIFDDSRTGVTDGARPIDPMVFYTRLAQRMIHLLNTVTSGGMLYEVDTRLRPSGASGLLVSPVSGFTEYQRNEAWTWEHQALVRARCVAGDKQLAVKFGDIRKQVLSHQRDSKLLADEVSEMREKMRVQLDTSRDGMFDLKQGQGGITDIEFIVQYAVLAWSANLPQLLVYTDNIRILEALVATNRLTADEGNMLADAYRFYRHLANHCVLQEKPAIVPIAEVGDYPSHVDKIWQRWLSSKHDAAQY